MNVHQSGDRSGNADPSSTSDRFDPASLAAFEALVDAGWDVAQVPAELRPAATRLAATLEPLVAPAPSMASPGRSLAARILDRLTAHEVPASLSPADAAAADAFIAAGYDAAAVPDGHRARAEKHAAIASLVRASSIATDGSLASRTLRLVELVENPVADELAPIPISRGSWLRRRTWDAVAAAAMLLVAASIMWPVLAGMRERSMQVQCASNMQQVASAMSLYAGEHDDSLPVAVASFGPQRWWDVDAQRPVANSSNLFTLVKNGYTKLTSLACPGNPTAARAGAGPEQSDWRSLDEISYSYQLVYGQRPQRWSASERRLILADRSPAVLRAVRGERPIAAENSPNHHGAGQHGLFTDGSAQWLDSACVKREDGTGDCIWLPRPPRFQFEGTLVRQEDGDVVLNLTGRELPSDVSDVFLGP
ncbi:MAG: hypothetical protein GIKADHBN_03681 [Phycisphaerales bacterium]|nr:hypothetical protein [Phycisphaerales bacterium]